ncbi:M50 family metallopeptidase [Cohnella rhizosphaerae]|uniref:M50 family metallopeptidase n=1 Tax=Cohnella rhizosphaerae TaxID=1457232 RepID=UPI0030B9002B
MADDPYLFGGIRLPDAADPVFFFFRNLDTMMHEFSHALAALLLSGRVLGIELHSDHSGVTYTMLASSWSSLPVSMSGYIGASLFSLLLFALYRRRAQRLGLALIVAVAATMLILFVHGGFGMAWLASFIALTGTMLFLGPKIRSFYYLLLAFLTLEESALGPITLALTALGSPSRAGDATNLANATGVPAIFLGVVVRPRLSRVRDAFAAAVPARQKRRQGIRTLIASDALSALT